MKINRIKFQSKWRQQWKKKKTIPLELQHSKHRRRRRRRKKTHFNYFLYTISNYYVYHHHHQNNLIYKKSNIKIFLYICLLERVLIKLKMNIEKNQIYYILYTYYNILELFIFILKIKLQIRINLKSTNQMNIWILIES